MFIADKPGSAFDSSNDALVSGIRAMVENQDVRERIRRAARDRIETHFSFTRRMEKVGRVYDEVLGRHGGTFGGTLNRGKRGYGNRHS